mmetsp:Transcript_10398/g.33203  ORF Transcript_10398/g.33203 Transcript_10398/m.33203 type:complete len:299 (-) Transcript_10398:1566-2462(-)
MAHTSAPTAGPTSSPSSEMPTSEPSTSINGTLDNATTVPRPGFDTDTTSNQGTHDSGGESSIIAWVIPLLVALAACIAAALWLFRRRQQQGLLRRESQNEDLAPPVDLFAAQDLGAVAGSRRRPGLGDATTQGDEDMQANPMIVGLKGWKPGDSNELVEMLEKCAKEDRIVHLYTNNPGIAMLLSGDNGCFVKCTQDSGDLIEGISAPRLVPSLFRRRGGVPKVNTELKVMKRDRWTLHVDPVSGPLEVWLGRSAAHTRELMPKLAPAGRCKVDRRQGETRSATDKPLCAERRKRVLL